MPDAITQQGYTQNRELSWLQFNARVLAEAEDENVPILERIKFLSIFTSNLDEFFMIRVGSLRDLAAMQKNAVIDNKSGMTPKEQLRRIYAAVAPLYERRDRAFADVSARLRDEGLTRLTLSELLPHEQKFVKQYFKNVVLPVLSPQIVDAHHPFPHLEGKMLYIGVLLRHKKNEVFGLLPVPASLPPLVFLNDKKNRYVSIEAILLEHAGSVFEMYDVLERTAFCITRNADINPGDENFDVESDFRRKMEKLLRTRRRLATVRVELTQPISDHFTEYFRKRFDVTDAQIFLSRAAPLRMEYAYGLGDNMPAAQRDALSEPPFSPQQPAMLPAGQSLLRQALRRDILLSYPYESMEPFLQMIREAAGDPAVVSIRITIYRLARKAKLVEYLCAAAENGKDVTALIELRARFDEQNNIDWSERLEEAGCKIIYGIGEYKVHSKICLITRQEKGGVRQITQVGTGNYNEKTAALYTDVSLITADPKIGADAATFFGNMGMGNLEGHYEHLLVAPYGLKNRILELIDQQAEKRENGYILLKFNSLTDIDIIRRLSEASCLGVKIDMIVRGICCLLPGVPGKTENITVTSVVGRYLEHSRIFCFGKGADEKMYISSADLMTRNTERRVEIACPIFAPTVRARLHEILYAMQCDTEKARVLKPDGSYEKKECSGEPVCAQVLLMQQAITSAHLAAEQAEPELSGWKKLWVKLRRHGGA